MPASGPPAVVVIGGGVIGSAAAMHLALGGAGVTVVERDPTYAAASSSLSASGIRQQYSQPVNIALGQYGVSFLRDAAAHLSVDDVIEPGATRDVIARALELAWGSRDRRVVRSWNR